MFDLSLLALGEERNLQWSCSWIDKLKESNQYHWTIVGEFTRKPLSFRQARDLSLASQRPTQIALNG